MSVTADQVKEKLTSTLEATSVEVVDTSGGCGSAFEVYVVSPQFEGKTLIARHRLVNDALKAEMAHIHALSIKKAQTPAQAAAAAPAPAST
ncbi:hypothetical protein HYH02_000986 [Chlamydomonas schloesseri]|uniref:Bola-like protein n=1 Tax=Chlamydomonas schloesseri TaxID=2026947 RepID=A0A835WWP4_9CHLO|nr:hypothetical protein HYH02_000986 [Chlamydomonas schloesseri]|eukprot:KAG2455170.1 hypothetical protein HYH02_000986 [Chlamydomonas schloesseri]